MSFRGERFDIQHGEHHDKELDITNSSRNDLCRTNVGSKARVYQHQVDIEIAHSEKLDKEANNMDLDFRPRGLLPDEEQTDIAPFKQSRVFVIGTRTRLFAISEEDSDQMLWWLREISKDTHLEIPQWSPPVRGEIALSEKYLLYDLPQFNSFSRLVASRSSRVTFSEALAHIGISQDKIESFPADRIRHLDKLTSERHPDNSGLW